MARIEKLELQGFKSFAKRSLILFPSNFSVVAGPNGSGKSNVMDSVCFVLGRTSAKSIRADKMHEVIYNGGRNKEPAELAKVSIFFDNTDRLMPVNDDSICVSRKVNRKGISIYKVNGETVTREKVLEILRAAKIFPDGHNIILQVDITDIINMSPLERREILDEISGIREYDEKREKAQRELLTVEDRLKGSIIVLGERGENLKKLEKDKEAAQRYKTLTAELDKLRASLASIKLNEAQEAMKKMELKIAEVDVSGIEKELDGIDRALDSLEKEREKLSKKLFDRSKDIELVREVERLKSDISKKRDRIEFARLELTRAEEMARKLESLQQMAMDSGAGRAVQEILKMGWTGVYGTIANLSKVPAQYQTAIEVAAGPHLYDIIVADENVAVECVNFLKRNKIGRATFLPLDKIRRREGRDLERMLNEKGVVGRAIDLISFDKRYEIAFSFIFGETIVADKIETVRKLGIGNARYVTLDGDLAERSGAIIGGFYRQDKRIFSDSGEILKLERDKKNLIAEVQTLETDIIRLQSELENLTKEE